MKTWLIALIAAGVLIALGGFLIKGYGNSKYAAGYTQALNDAINANEEAKDGARKTKETAAAEERAIPDSGLDDELRNLGIMRRNEDH